MVLRFAVDFAAVSSICCVQTPPLYHVASARARKQYVVFYATAAPHANSAPCSVRALTICDFSDAPTVLAACCGFDLCHKYILYLSLFCTTHTTRAQTTSKHTPPWSAHDIRSRAHDIRSRVHYTRQKAFDDLLGPCDTSAVVSHWPGYGTGNARRRRKENEISVCSVN